VFYGGKPFRDRLLQFDDIIGKVWALFRAPRPLLQQNQHTT